MVRRASISEQIELFLYPPPSVQHVTQNFNTQPSFSIAKLARFASLGDDNREIKFVSNLNVSPSLYGLVALFSMPRP